MEQSKYNEQESFVTETREPLPTYTGQSMPLMGQQQVHAQTAQPYMVSNPELNTCVESAFSKSLAATIMAWFPICSIIAIFFGSAGLKLADRANEMASYYGCSAGGKNIAAKVLGRIGQISGIAMTVFYAIYIFIIIIVVFCSM